MNTLRIKLNPYKDINIASLDDKPLSPYSELNNYMKEPFLKWADKLLGTAEREINDEYELIVAGESFEELFISDMQNDEDLCKSFKTEKYQISNSVDERFGYINEIATKYGIEVPLNDYKVRVYSEIELSVDSSYITVAPIENAFVYVTENKDLARQVLAKSGEAIVILLSDKSSVSSLGDMKYVWEIPSDRLKNVLDSVVDRFAKIPYIRAVAERIKGSEAALTEDDNEKLSLSTEIDMFISVLDVPTLEVGSEYTLEVKTTPETNEIPQLRIECSNTSVVMVEGITLKAIAPGKAFVDIYKKEELIPFARKEIETTQENFVKQIELTLPFPKMGIGRQQQIGITLLPNDADDINLVDWESSDSRVVSVDEDGAIVAHADGKVVVTASTTRVRSSVEVEVLPNLKAISLSETSVELYVGQTQEISISVSPLNAFDTTCIWQSSNKDVAVIEVADDGRQFIRAVGIGECTLTCSAKEGNCASSCSVIVESTFKKRENIHTFLHYTIIAAVAALVCSVLSVSIGALIAAGATVLFAVIAIGRNKKDILWAIVASVFAVICALLSLGLF